MCQRKTEEDVGEREVEEGGRGDGMRGRSMWGAVGKGERGRRSEKSVVRWVGGVGGQGKWENVGVGKGRGRERGVGGKGERERMCKEGFRD